MTVVLLTEGSVRAGGLGASADLVLEAAKLDARLGAAGARVLRELAAGERAGAWALWSEFDGGEAYGAYVDARVADVEAFALDRRLTARDGAVAIGHRAVLTEIALGGRRKKAVPGAIVELRRLRVLPGRADDAVAAAKDACAYAEKNGATNARLFRYAHAGAASGAVLTSWDFAGGAELGQSLTAWEEPGEKGRPAGKDAPEAPAVLEWRGTFHAVAG